MVTTCRVRLHETACRDHSVCGGAAGESGPVAPAQVRSAVVVLCRPTIVWIRRETIRATSCGWCRAVKPERRDQSDCSTTPAKGLSQESLLFGPALESPWAEGKPVIAHDEIVSEALNHGNGELLLADRLTE